VAAQRARVRPCPRQSDRPDLLTLTFTTLLRRIRFHDLRRSTATLLLAQGVHFAVIKELLGHARIGVTATVYPHLRLRLQRDAIDTLGTVLGTPEIIRLAPEAGTGAERPRPLSGLSCGGALRVSWRCGLRCVTIRTRHSTFSSRWRHGALIGWVDVLKTSKADNVKSGSRQKEHR
jgi:hypothetical protein